MKTCSKWTYLLTQIRVSDFESYWLSYQSIRTVGDLLLGSYSSLLHVIFWTFHDLDLTTFEI